MTSQNATLQQHRTTWPAWALAAAISLPAQPQALQGLRLLSQLVWEGR